MSQRISIIFAIITLSIFVVPQVGIDLYLPALPNMQQHLQSSQFAMQMTLTVYILTMGLTQLIYGPLSDQYGRKPVIIIGTVIFLLGSILTSLATNSSILLSGRVLQGAGMGASFTVASAILADVYEGKQLARMTAFSSMVYSLSPLLAPVLGGFFTQYLGWRMNFLFMTIMAAILLACLTLFTHETNHNKNPNACRLSSLISNYLAIIKHIRFMAYIMSLTMAFGCTIAFNVLGPFLMQNVLHVTPLHYGWLLLILGGAYLVGTSTNNALLKWMRVPTLIWLGLMILLSSTLAILLSGLLDWFKVASVTIWMSTLIFGTGFIFPNCMAKALEIFPNKQGSATALMGALGLIGTSIISTIIGHFHIYTALELFSVYIIIGSLCLLSFTTALIMEKTG